jgi:ribosomal protein S18 acetylase RimI-like enzyme
MAASVKFHIESLSSAHDRSQFASGSEPLDRYLREQASQDIKRRVATCFVAMPTGKEQIAGYYTLTATSVALGAVADEIAKRLPRYPVVPAALVGRLAVSKEWQREGLGSALLADALLRISRAELGVFAMLVDAKDEYARRFYEHFGFTLLLGHDQRLMLPIATALLQLQGKEPRAKK